mgnify:CR=1 FL=1|jgi:protein required for attachment to host cells
MIHKIKKKLLLIADAKLAKFYLAEDFKIKSLVKEFTVEDAKIHHDRQLRKTGKFNKSSGSGPRFFDPHSEAKDLDRSDFCKAIMYEMSKLFDETSYDQLILVCGPKMLGGLRNEFPAKLKAIDIKEFRKELIHDNVKQIEEEVLEELKFK